ANSGVGNAVGLTGDTGYFWFFQDTNVELVVKVLDGRPVNGAYWVFYGALSDVQYTITVTDTLSHASRTYENPSGHQASRADTSASPQAGAASPIAAPPSTAVRPKGILPACSADSTALCLNGGRFRVTVDWSVPSQGQSGHGSAVEITDDTGYFWFF